MKKLVKIFAVVLAVLMLGSVLVACDKGNTENETTAETASPSVTVKIMVKANGKTVYPETEIKTTKTTLGEALDIFCAYQGDDVKCVFDAAGLLSELGTVKPADGEFFRAYDAAEGQDKEFPSIKDHKLVDGQTIVIDIAKN